MLILYKAPGNVLSKIICFYSLYAIRLELLYSDPNWSFKVSEIFKEMFYHYHTTSRFPWPHEESN